jgi:hypothetical protein
MIEQQLLTIQLIECKMIDWLVIGYWLAVNVNKVA